MSLWRVKLVATNSRGIAYCKIYEYRGHDVDLYVKRLVTDFIFTHGLLNMTIQIKALGDPLQSPKPQLAVIPQNTQS
jgi:hypothetical protein